MSCTMNCSCAISLQSKLKDVGGQEQSYNNAEVGANY